ncbi:MAG: sigma-70 factor domain-containing protein, partial [Synechococcus sp.]|nr:sigma-70 factor domain-containing protein [Synechococcus sp.]
MSPVAAKPITKAKAAAPEILMVATASGETVTVKTPPAARKPAAAAAAGEETATKKPRASRSRAAKAATAEGAEATAAPEAEAAKGVKAAGKATTAKAAKTPKAKATKASAGKARTVKAKEGEATGEADLDLAADELLAAAGEGSDDGKSAKEAKDAKALASIKVGPKGVYTEDSIRVYLQEIGRIRLLRPDEEIELARKIADLLQLEELAAQFEADKGHYPDTKEWAALVDMPLVKFRRRLMLGRRAKEKMVQSNLRLVVSIAKKYMNRGLSFQDLIQEGS